MPQLTRRGSFAAGAAVAGIALWASAAPTMVYPQYADAWALSTATTSALFAVYPLALVPTLVIFGNLSDSIGRRATILVGLAALAAGSVAFGLAQDVSWAFVGRALMGVGVGFALSPATAAMVENARRPERAGSATTAATAGGLVVATLVGGALVQYAPDALHLSFWVLAVATATAFALSWFLPRHQRDAAQPPWRPRRPMVPASARTRFVAGALGIGAAYSMGAIYLALGAHIARDLLGSGNTFVDGAMIALSAVAIGTVAIAARRLPARTALLSGPILATVGLGALIVAGSQHSVALFVLSSVVGGAGYALLFSGGLGAVTQSAPPDHRAMVLSAAYVVGYVLQAGTALGLGELTRQAGLESALVVGVPVILAIGYAAALLVRHPAAIVGNVTQVSHHPVLEGNTP